MRFLQMVAVVLIAQTMAGCSGSPIAGPSLANGTPTPIPSDPPKPAPIPSDAPKPTIYYISPGSGPSYGGDQVTIFGVIDPGATATIGGIPVRLAWSATDPTKHILYSPPHAAGRVDIVVTNPDGGSRTYFGGYTYVEPGSLAQPTIVSISPDTGSIYGGGEVTIVGPTERGAIAFVGGIQVAMGWSPTDPTKHILYSPPHAAGRVDIVVRNPDGGSQTLGGGFTYVDPGSFDLNGSWAGWTVDGADMWVEFTIREHMLTSVRCTDALEKTVEISLSQPVVNGKVEFVGDAGRFSAWVASASEAAGTIDMAPCSGGHPWEATAARR